MHVCVTAITENCSESISNLNWIFGTDGYRLTESRLWELRFLCDIVLRMDIASGTMKSVINLVDVRLTCLTNITYLLTYLLN